MKGVWWNKRFAHLKPIIRVKGLEGDVWAFVINNWMVEVFFRKLYTWKYYEYKFQQSKYGLFIQTPWFTIDILKRYMDKHGKS
jgi:hypothetical protein